MTVYELRQHDFLYGHYARTPDYNVTFKGKKVFLEGDVGTKGYRNNFLYDISKVTRRDDNTVDVELSYAEPISRRYAERWNPQLLKDYYVKRGLFA